MTASLHPEFCSPESCCPEFHRPGSDVRVTEPLGSNRDHVPGSPWNMPRLTRPRLMQHGRLRPLVPGVLASVLLWVLSFVPLLALAGNADDKPVAEADPQPEPKRLGPGDHVRTLQIGQTKRTYLVHIPEKLDPEKRPEQTAPVVLALHGAAMNGPMMAWLSGLNKKSDEAGFIVAYPSGTGPAGLLTWNAGGFTGKPGVRKPDDVAFIGKVLDDMATVANIDTKRVFACGMSNGAMMSYRLAAEMSDRIAAIAPVAGTIAIENSRPQRAVPVLHIHGTEDRLVPFGGPSEKLPAIIKFKSVADSIQTWVKLDGCDEAPATDVLSRDGDELKITRTTYSGGRDGAEVVLIVVEGGGHTWPGRPTPARFLGKTARNISADDLIWEFFEKHPMQ